MRKARTLLVLLTSLLFLASTAHAIDLAPYFGLKAGKWNQYQRFDQCGNSLNEEGLAVAKTADGYFLYKHYKKKDNSWVYEDDTIFKVTSTKIKIVGFTDDNETSLFTPAIAIPRTMGLNTPYVYKGTVVNQSTLESEPGFMSVMVVESGLTITTSAQTFTGCIKVVINEAFGNDVNGSIHFMCSWRGDVKIYDVSTEKSMDPASPVDSSVRIKDLKAFGNSKSPF